MPIVSMNSSTGIPLRIWTFLNTASDITGAWAGACAADGDCAATHRYAAQAIIDDRMNDERMIGCLIGSIDHPIIVHPVIDTPIGSTESAAPPRGRPR